MKSLSMLQKNLLVLSNINHCSCTNVSPSLRLHACMCVSYGFDLTLLVVQRPGPPLSRPELTPSPDQRKQHIDLFEGEASEPEANTDPTTTSRQQVRLIILTLLTV